MANTKEILEAMIQEVESAEQELVGLKKAANAFARRGQMDLPYPDADASSPSRSGATMIRPDLFVSFSAPAAAARAFLEHRGQQRGAASIDDIFDALRRGGYSFDTRTDNEAKGALKVALAKDFNVHKIDNGAYGVSYGLLSWYPGLRERREGQEKRDGQTENAVAKPSRKPRRGAEDEGQAELPASESEEGQEV
jgi:hypothetical protein